MLAQEDRGENHTTGQDIGGNMDWSKSSVNTADTHITKTIYGGIITDSEGINLRQEMNWILYGKNTPPVRKPKGHWVVYRRFDRSKKSKYYKSSTHEGVGGPAYKYTDELLKTRRVPLDEKGQPLDALEAGLAIGDRYAYYLEYTVVPKRGDQIFEINWSDHGIRPSNIDNITFNEKYVIKRTHPYRLEDGNIQYYIVSTKFDEITY